MTAPPWPTPSCLNRGRSMFWGKSHKLGVLFARTPRTFEPSIRIYWWISRKLVCTDEPRIISLAFMLITWGLVHHCGEPIKLYGILNAYAANLISPLLNA